MTSVRKLMAEGWAPSVSVLLHGLVFAALFMAVDLPTFPTSHERTVPVTLISLAPPQPPQPAPALPPAAVEEPPPIATTAETAPEVAPPLKKPLPKKEKPPPKPEAHKSVPAPAQIAAMSAPAEPAPSAAPVGAVPQPSESAGPSPSYLALLRQKLERNKVYPHLARARKEQGTALLRFVVDRHGHVLARHLDRSTGHSNLDREVEAMLDRAQPLPEMPAEMTQVQIELVVPVQFYLR
jgi:periplasmic protein TonB